jgi:hypothetical protein
MNYTSEIKNLTAVEEEEVGFLIPSFYFRNGLFRSGNRQLVSLESSGSGNFRARQQTLHANHFILFLARNTIGVK